VPCSRHAASRFRVQSLQHPNPIVPLNGKAPAGAPIKGANSFTEAQAKDRALAAGLTSVSSLVKDGDGIWRGTAMKNGKTQKVAVDFKGNVVSQ